MMSGVPDHDRLMAQLLSKIDRVAEGQVSSSELHPEEETIALFSLGELRRPERDEVVRHLTECSECRQTAAALMTWPEFAASVPTERQIRFGTRGNIMSSVAWMTLAVAASVLVAIGLLIRFDVFGPAGARTEAEAYARASGMIRRGQFDEAGEVVAAANRRGIASDRLRNVETQAIRRIPGPIILAYSGRLTHFGHEIGGVTARSTSGVEATGKAEKVLEVLALAGPNDVTAALNRGHALMTLQRPREALAEFKRVADLAPNSSLARLGQGLAFYALADYPAAEEAFRSSVQLDANQTDARINLAMTLAEEGKNEPALATWNEVLGRSEGLTERDRLAIEQEVGELRSAIKRPPTSSLGEPNKEPR